MVEGKSERKADWLSTASARADFYTGKASDVIRALALTCIAVVWLFAAGGINDTDPANTLAVLNANEGLRLALWGSIAAAVLDVLQYVLGALGWLFIRWCMAEALQRDIDAHMSWQTRAIWFISRVVRLPEALAEALGTTTDGWPATRDELRIKIRHERANVPGLLNQAGTDGPSNVFDTGTTLLFVLKTIAILIAYIGLATAV